MTRVNSTIVHGRTGQTDDIQRAARKTVRTVADGTDHPLLGKQVANARSLVKAALSTLGTQAHLPAMTLGNLASTARLAAPSWMSLTAMNPLQRQGLTFALQSGQTLSLPQPNGGQKTVAGPATVTSTELMAFLDSHPAAFNKAMQLFDAKAVRLNAVTQELEFNPYLTEAKAVWEKSEAKATPHQRESQGQDQRQKQQESADEHEQDSDEDDAAAIEATDAKPAGMVLLADDPTAFMPPLPDSPSAALKGLALNGLEDARAALTSGPIDLVSGDIDGLVGVFAQFESKIRDLLGDLISAHNLEGMNELLSDPSIPVDQLIMMVMMGAADDYDSQLRDAMDEAALAEQNEQSQAQVQDAIASAAGQLSMSANPDGAHFETSGTGSGAASSLTSPNQSSPGASSTPSDNEPTSFDSSGVRAKSTTILFQELQILTQRWKQMNDLISNISKTLHDTAMAAVRNIR